MKKTCESCLIPLDKDIEDSGSDKYCSYCYKDGNLLYQGDDVKEFQRLSYKGMRESGMNPLIARFFTFIIRFAPRWKK